jgi:hypothetical protein
MRFRWIDLCFFCLFVYCTHDNRIGTRDIQSCVSWGSHSALQVRCYTPSKTKTPQSSSAVDNGQVCYAQLGNLTSSCPWVIAKTSWFVMIGVSSWTELPLWEITRRCHAMVIRVYILHVACKEVSAASSSDSQTLGWHFLIGMGWLCSGCSTIWNKSWGPVTKCTDVGTEEPWDWADNM